MRNKPKRIRVAAGDIEAWTTGDDDFLESPLLKALNKAQEEVSRDGKARSELLVIIEE
jgi:hypothetical protein